MTEAEWKRCRDPRRMLEALYLSLDRRETGPRACFVLSEEKQQELLAAIRSGRPPRGHVPEDRKFLLFLAACCRRVEHLLVPEERRALIDLHERYADDAMREKELAAAERRRDAATHPGVPSGGRAERFAAEAASWLLRGGLDTDHEELLDAIDRAVQHDPAYADPDGEGPHQAALLRDIFGTPYAAPRFDRAWRTATSVQLARQMYDGRDFSAMPILADALQDAGCDSEEVLSHCRDANQVHVRGCWVVDLILGKS